MLSTKKKRKKKEEELVEDILTPHTSQTSSSDKLSPARIAIPSLMDLVRQHTDRWKPTDDQVRILWEIFYNNGGLLISREQATSIASLLQQYGRAETFNVYCWFRNRRAKAGTRHTRTSFAEPYNSTMSTLPRPRHRSTRNGIISPLHDSGDHAPQNPGGYAAYPKRSAFAYRERETLSLFPTQPSDANEAILSLFPVNPGDIAQMRPH